MTQLEYDWPALPLDAWEPTCATLHLWTQVVGKIRMVFTPLVNHWWNVTLYVSARGLTTSPIPYGTRSFEIVFDFIDHKLVIQTSEGATERIALKPMAVADFYSEVRTDWSAWASWRTSGPMPSEIENSVPFEQDRAHAKYDSVMVQRFWQALLHADREFKVFRSRFIGKVSPVHLFWGSFDLAVTRFLWSHRTASWRCHTQRRELGNGRGLFA
jgi:hypothetical protein